MKKYLATFALLSLLTACADDTTSIPKLDYGYTADQKINLTVQNLGVIDHTLQLPNSPYVGHQLNPTVDQALHQWAADRLQAVGRSGQITFVIKDASLTTSTLKVDHGVDKLLTRQQGTKYTAHAEVEISVKGKIVYGSASAEASRSATMPENPTDEERKAIYIGILNGLMQDLNRNIEASINQHLSDFVAGSPLIEDVTRPSVFPITTP